ncbi:MAG: hypothetical protein WC478_05145, partial [Candidatus Omnitrophota bacterium]
MNSRLLNDLPSENKAMIKEAIQGLVDKGMNVSIISDNERGYMIKAEDKNGGYFLRDLYGGDYAAVYKTGDFFISRVDDQISSLRHENDNWNLAVSKLNGNLSLADSKIDVNDRALKGIQGESAVRDLFRKTVDFVGRSYDGDYRKVLQFDTLTLSNEYGSASSRNFTAVAPLLLKENDSEDPLIASTRVLLASPQNSWLTSDFTHDLSGNWRVYFADGKLIEKRYAASQLAVSGVEADMLGRGNIATHFNSKEDAYKIIYRSQDGTSLDLLAKGIDMFGANRVDLNAAYSQAGTRGVIFKNDLFNPVQGAATMTLELDQEGALAGGHARITDSAAPYYTFKNFNYSIAEMGGEAGAANKALATVAKVNIQGDLTVYNAQGFGKGNDALEGRLSFEFKDFVDTDGMINPAAKPVFNDKTGFFDVSGYSTQNEFTSLAGMTHALVSNGILKGGYFPGKAEGAVVGSINSDMTLNVTRLDKSGVLKSREISLTAGKELLAGEELTKIGGLKLRRVGVQDIAPKGILDYGVNEDLTARINPAKLAQSQEYFDNTERNIQNFIVQSEAGKSSFNAYTRQDGSVVIPQGEHLALPLSGGNPFEAGKLTLLNNEGLGPNDLAKARIMDSLSVNTIAIRLGFHPGIWDGNRMRSAGVGLYDRKLSEARTDTFYFAGREQNDYIQINNRDKFSGSGALAWEINGKLKVVSQGVIPTAANEGLASVRELGNEPLPVNQLKYAEGAITLAESLQKPVEMVYADATVRGKITRQISKTGNDFNKPSASYEITSGLMVLPGAAKATATGSQQQSVQASHVSAGLKSEITQVIDDKVMVVNNMYADLGLNDRGEFYFQPDFANLTLENKTGDQARILGGVNKDNRFYWLAGGLHKTTDIGTDQKIAPKVMDILASDNLYFDKKGSILNDKNELKGNKGVLLEWEINPAQETQKAQEITRITTESRQDIKYLTGYESESTEKSAGFTTETKNITVLSTIDPNKFHYLYKGAVGRDYSLANGTYEEVINGLSLTDNQASLKIRSGDLVINTDKAFYITENKQGKPGGDSRQVEPVYVKVGNELTTSENIYVAEAAKGKISVLYDPMPLNGGYQYQTLLDAAGVSKNVTMAKGGVWYDEQGKAIYLDAQDFIRGRGDQLQFQDIHPYDGQRKIEGI